MIGIISWLNATPKITSTKFFWINWHNHFRNQFWNIVMALAIKLFKKLIQGIKTLLLYVCRPLYITFFFLDIVWCAINIHNIQIDSLTFVRLTFHPVRGYGTLLKLLQVQLTLIAVLVLKDMDPWVRLVPQLAHL